MEPWTLPRMIFDFCAVQMDENRIMVLGKAYLHFLSNLMAGTDYGRSMMPFFIEI